MCVCVCVYVCVSGSPPYPPSRPGSSHAPTPKLVRHSSSAALGLPDVSQDEMLPRQSVEGGKSIQKRVRTRFPLLKTTALRGKLTFGDPFEDSGVVVLRCKSLNFGAERNPVSCLPTLINHTPTTQHFRFERLMTGISMFGYPQK